MAAASATSSKPMTATSSGHLPAEPLEGLEGADRHGIVRHEDAVEVGVAAEERLHRPCARVLAEVAVLDEPFPHPLAGVAERVRVPLEPVDPDGHVQRAGDRRDLAAAGGEQVGGRRPRAAAIVGVHVGEPFARPRPAAQHGGNAGVRQGARQRVVAVQRHENDAVDMAVPDVALDLHVLALAAREEQQKLELGVGDRGRDALHDGGEERVREDAALGLGDDEGDRVGALRDQAAGRAVRDVAEPVDRLLDRLARVRPDLGGAVDHPGHGGRGDGREPRHLLERRGRSAPSAIARDRLYILGHDVYCKRFHG